MARDRRVRGSESINLESENVMKRNESAKKSNAVVSYLVSFVDGKKVITFNVLGAGKLAFHPDRASEQCRNDAEDNGWIQRIVDKAAIGRDPQTGKSATPEQKLAAMRAIVEHYESGTEQWSMVREGSGEVQAGLTLQAIAFIKKMTLDAAAAAVKKQAEEYGLSVQKVLGTYRTQHSGVKAKYEELQKARMPEPAFDVEEALGRIGK